ncbi:MAG: hypothetical protein GXO10_01430 [Crenarchaeota archaeon]|nr:hypothetical protein [Thermoproteota archaeon]
MRTIRETVNIPGLGSRSMIFKFTFPEKFEKEHEIILKGIKEFIENGEQIGDIDIDNFIIEFFLLREEDLGEFYRSYYIAVLRRVDAPGTECVSVYRFIIDYRDLTVTVDDVSNLANISR